ncbi:Hypp2129 [Branchiostoma lanceolatum]|uniref:Hypp2129 protein n=1 Tax=Branchiostoma lanceolatum TaxID=7740 RepID=A0A8J9ZNY8_BRALA|nr:Hypp2129 [Branchiostoma lanceolatum]
MLRTKNVSDSEETRTEKQPLGVASRVCLENANSGLRAEIARLRQELKRLSVHVMNHMELCHAAWRTEQLTAAPRTDNEQDSATPQD